MLVRPLPCRLLLAVSFSLGAATLLLLGIAFSCSFAKEAQRHQRKLQLAQRNPARPPNLLLISVDALRPDYLGAYGSPRGASPNLDRWARQAVVVERAYCQVPHTSFSLTSLHVGASLYLDEETLRERPPPAVAEILATAGYETAAFFPPAVFFIDSALFTHYQRRHFGFQQVQYAHLDAAQRVEQILAYLGQDRARPFFVWAHFFDTHEPYRVRPGFTQGKRAVDRYAGEVAYVDHHLGRLLARVAADHPDTAILLTADHGEEFGETGAYYHGNSLREPQIRIPWILQAPGLSPRRLPGPAQVIDVPLTLLALAGVKPPPTMAGRNLLPWLSAAAPAPWPPVLSELDFKKALLTNRHALLCNYQTPACQIYDLARGPSALVRPAEDIGGELRQRLERQLTAALVERVPPQQPDRSSCQQLLWRIKRRDPHPLDELSAACTTPEERLQMVELLLQLRSPLALEPLVTATNDPSPEIRLRALIGAACLGHAPSLAQVPRLLQTPEVSPVLRREALIALAEAGDLQAAQQLVTLLEGSEDLYEQVSLITLLGRLRHQSAEGAVLARVDQLRTRLAAIQALGLMGSRSALPELIETLHGARYITWRRAAAKALGHFPEREVRGALARALREEIEPDVVREILRSWQRIGGGQLPGLRALPRDGWRCSGGRGCTLRTTTPCDGAELLLLSKEQPGASKPLELRCGDGLVTRLERPQRGALVRLDSSGELLRLQTPSGPPLPLQLLSLRRAP